MGLILKSSPVKQAAAAAVVMMISSKAHRCHPVVPGLDDNTCHGRLCNWLMMLCCEQGGKQIIDIRAMLNDVTRLSHIDDTGDVGDLLTLTDISY